MPKIIVNRNHIVYAMIIASQRWDVF